jgi:AraC-like DNA-binding protein
MVCPRCIDSVKEIFNELDIETLIIELGEVTTTFGISPAEKTQLEEKLASKGFELLEDQKSKVIAQIKATIIEQIHHSKERLTVNFSTLLSDRLNQDYTNLSKLFSSVEGITIEKYVLKQKIEKVKELIVYNELNLSEIAFQLDYSSVAHLSSQFKKETGMTPTEFKKLKNRDRNTLDSI